MTRSTRRVRTTGVVVGLLLAPLALAGCGDAESSDDPGSATGASSPSSASTAPAVIAVTVQGDQVTPNGERVEVGVGQPIELDVTADADGEIHVHSDPEQEFTYEAGETTLMIAPVQRPGIVDVESHSLDKTIVQLQVQ